MSQLTIPYLFALVVLKYSALEGFNNFPGKGGNQTPLNASRILGMTSSTAFSSAESRCRGGDECSASSFSAIALLSMIVSPEGNLTVGMLNGTGFCEGSLGATLDELVRETTGGKRELTESWALERCQDTQPILFCSRCFWSWKPDVLWRLASWLKYSIQGLYFSMGSETNRHIGLCSGGRRECIETWCLM